MRQKRLIGPMLLILLMTGTGWVSGCTTVGATGRATAGGVTILAKNRDYPVDAGQILFFEPTTVHPADAMVEMQHISILQYPDTYQLLGFKALDERGRGSDLWRWGLGMGQNRHQLAVTNDDANTWDKYTEPALHDNDITRLILERCATAREAVALVDELISCYRSNVPEIYTVADPAEVWIIETTGTHWAAKRVVDDVFARANRFEITDPDLPDDTIFYRQSRRELVAFARKNGRYQEEDGRFSFRLSYSDDYSSPVNIHYNETRYRRAMELLTAIKGKATPEGIAVILRDHYEGWKFPLTGGGVKNLFTGHGDPHCDLTETMLPGHPTRTICYGGTVGSMISVLDTRAPGKNGVMWACFSIPCLGTYVPFFPRAGFDPEPEAVRALDRYDDGSAYWLFSAIWRNLSPRWDAQGGLIRQVRARNQAWEEKERRRLGELLRKAEQLDQGGKTDKTRLILTDFSRKCLRESLKMVRKTRSKIRDFDPARLPPVPFQRQNY